MSQDHSAAINALPDGFARSLGITFTRVTSEEIACELRVGPQHLQPYGIVHGGVYCAIIETLCSVGAGVDGLARGLSVVGLENHTSFLRAVRGGVLRGSARGLMKGKRSQVWEAVVTDEAGAVAATGRVRLICLEAGADLAGKVAGVQT
jgi:uncharacterized protein (TIGR00369 family)